MRHKHWSPHILGVLWVLAAAGALVTPALIHGSHLGPFDALAQYGLSVRHAVVPNYSGPRDQVEQMIPWTALAWTQVHHGQLPLWNPYSALGTPLAFNWLSAPFSVPALLGYLVPLGFDFTLQVLVTLAVAGTGVYVLGRVLGFGVLGCTMAATTFELSGAFVGWLGWPLASVMSWSGWLFASALLVVRGRNRPRDIALLALVVAAAVYAGQPNTSGELFMALVVFLVIALVISPHPPAGRKAVARPVADTAVAAVAGGLLAAPLILPGLQVASHSIRRVVGHYGPLPGHDLLHVVLSDFDGLPVHGNSYFGNSVYPETAACVGVIGLVLAVIAVAGCRRRSEVIAFGVLTLAAAFVVFVPPVVSLLHSLPDGKEIAWQQALLPMDFALAVLAGFGTEVLVSTQSRRVLWWALTGFVAAGALLALVWALGRGNLPAAEASVRAGSFLGPAVDVAIGLVAVGGILLFVRRMAADDPEMRRSRLHARRLGAVLLLAGETGFLVAAGAPLISSSSTYLSPTPAESTLARAIGSSVVALGTDTCREPPTLGIVPNVNVALGVKEFADYDPMIPQAYFRSWKVLTGREAGIKSDPLTYCPAMATASEARLYGVSYVLEPADGPRPEGAVFDMKVGDESLYSVPGAAAATLTSLGADGRFPAADAKGRPVSVQQPTPRSWKVETVSTRPGVLRLHLSDMPGWHASMDGRSLALHRYAGVMLEARIPAGRHTIELSYWPTSFTAGIALAALSLVVLAGMNLICLARRRRSGG